MKALPGTRYVSLAGCCLCCSPDNTENAMANDTSAQHPPDHGPVLRSIGIAAAGVVAGFLLGTLSPQLSSSPSPSLTPPLAGIQPRGLVPTAIVQPAGLVAGTSGDRGGRPEPSMLSAPLDPTLPGSGRLEPCWAVLTDLVHC
jgi:hypothetical protein